MEFGIRKLIGFVALQALRESRVFFVKSSNSALNELQEEVLSGKCVLTQNSDGDVERVAAVTVLRVERADGCVFAQLGKIDGNGVAVPDCKLPGSKQERGETIDDAVQRVLSETLGPLEEGVVLGKVETMVQWKESKDFGIRTKYLRGIQYTTIGTSYEIPTIPYSPSSVVRPVPTGAEGTCMLLENHGLYIINGRGKELIYAWLTNDELERFSSPE